MARIEIDLIINRPIEEVFAFVSNAENLPRWRTTALEVRKSFTGPLAVGSIFKGRFTFLGRRFEGNLEIIVYEPNRRYATRMVEGPFPLETHYILDATKIGTWFTFIVEGRPGGFFRLAEPLVVSLAKRFFESDLYNLKEMLEAEAVQVA
ncbi:MAG: SRPBCC family protein [Anaerolineae bacterium]|nr:SRPBCC family protein [Anaerolineae bacterium]